MNLERAQKQKAGNLVAVPKDGAFRRNPGYTGRITHVSPVIATNIHGTEYVWIEVQHPITGNKSVWPSHRLGAYQ